KLVVAGVAAHDREADIAILSVPYPFTAQPLEMATGEIAVGTKVFAIGSPRGLTNTLSDGVVSAHREIDEAKPRMIQTTSPISPGSSGGPLLGPDGKVVGVTTLSRPDGQNLNFAVPVSYVEKLVDRSRSAGGQLTQLPLP